MSREFFFFEDQTIRGTYSSVFTKKNLKNFSRDDLNKAIHVISKQDLQPLVDKLKDYRDNEWRDHLFDAADEFIKAWEGSDVQGK